MDVKKQIEVSFDIVAARALSAYLPTSEHNVTKQHLEVLRAYLKDYIGLKDEKQKAEAPDNLTPPPLSNP